MTRDRERPRRSWRRLGAVITGYLVLTGSALSPAADRDTAAPAAPGRAHGIAVDGRVATTADVRSDVRHG